MIKNKNIDPAANIAVTKIALAEGKTLVGDSDGIAQEQTAASTVSLADNKFLLGDGNGDATAVTLSGDVTSANDGTMTVGAVLDGGNAANVANDNAVGGMLVVHAIAVAGGAAANEDITLTHKTRVIDVWAQHTGGNGESSDTLTVSDGSTAITNAMDWSGNDNIIVRAASIDDAAATIAASGTLRATTVDDDTGGDVGAGIVYVLGFRVA